MPLNKGKVTLLQCGVILENERRIKMRLPPRISPIWKVIPYSKKRVFNHFLRRKVLTFDQIEFDIVPTYSTSMSTRSKAKDSWISSMSTKYARNTYMKIDNKFYRQFLRVRPSPMKSSKILCRQIVRTPQFNSYFNTPGCSYDTWYKKLPEGLPIKVSMEPTQLLELKRIDHLLSSFKKEVQL
jgi:hypothetical protein